MGGAVRDALTGAFKGGGLDLSFKQGAAVGFPDGQGSELAEAAQPGAWAAQRVDHHPAQMFVDRCATSSRRGVGRLACTGRGQPSRFSRLATGRRTAFSVARSLLWAGVLAALRCGPRPFFWRGV